MPSIKPDTITDPTPDPFLLQQLSISLIIRGGRKELPSMETVTSSSLTLIELKRSLVPPRWEDSVRVLGMSECKAAGLSLAHAFAADDLAQYLVNSDDMTDASAEDKWKLHVDLMTYIVAATCHQGIATAIGPDYEGVALW